MPYIKHRDKFKKLEAQIAKLAIIDAGELNYLITKLCIKYLKDSGVNQGYALYNSVVGVLECAKLEFYRRKLVDYEDIKIKENGDVYG